MTSTRGKYVPRFISSRNPYIGSRTPRITRKRSTTGSNSFVFIFILYVFIFLLFLLFYFIFYFIFLQSRVVYNAKYFFRPASNARSKRTRGSVSNTPQQKKRTSQNSLLFPNL